MRSHYALEKYPIISYLHCARYLVCAQRNSSLEQKRSGQNAAREKTARTCRVGVTNNRGNPVLTRFDRNVTLRAES